MKQTKFLKSLILLLSVSRGIHAQNDYYTYTAAQDWTDGAVITTSTGENADDAVDNDLSTNVILRTFENGMWIMAEMSEPIKVTGYSVSAGLTPANSPRTWKLQGSNDLNGDWTDINTQSGVTLSNEGETKLVTMARGNNDSYRNDGKGYKYFRLLIEENNGGTDLELSEWQLYGFPIQLTTNITSNGGTITGEFAGFGGEGAENIIDPSISKKYCANMHNKGWVEYESAAFVRPTGYAIVAGVANAERDPKSWVFEGYNYSTQKWEELDVETDQQFTDQTLYKQNKTLVWHNTLRFKVNADKSYTRLRLRITENQGDGHMQFCKWLIYGEQTSEPIVKKRVACVGNSITANALLAAEDKYPAILGSLLGDEYTVKNFGVGGSCLLKESDHPYWGDKKWADELYTKALAFNPDIIVVKLGTNDSKQRNWQYKDKFVDEYKEFINSFKEKNPNLQVIICTPNTSWNNTMSIVDKTVREEMIPMIRTVADETGATLVDLHTLTEGKLYQTYDFVHPDVRGTTIMAQNICKAIKPDAVLPEVPQSYVTHIESFDRTDVMTRAEIDGNSDLSTLFDNDITTTADLGTFKKGMALQMTLPEDFIMTGYSITTNCNDTKDTPKSWVVQVSADGKDWKDLDTKSNQIFNYPVETSIYQIEFNEEIPAGINQLPKGRYLRIVFNENNGGAGNLILSEVQIFGMNDKLQTSITGNGGTITGQYKGYNENGYVEIVENLITDAHETKYCVTGHNNGWIQYESAEAVVIGSYAITNAFSWIGRNLKDWQLLGSNDGENWDVLDEQNEQSFTVRMNSREYPVNTNNSYKYFRLNITRNNGAGEYQFAKWQLFEPRKTVRTLNNGFVTYSSTENIDFSQIEDLDAYTVKYVGGKGFTTEISQPVAANTGVLLHGQPNTTYWLNSCENGVTPEENDLLPTSTGAVTSDGTHFTLDDNTQKVGFAKLESGKTIPTDKAYLKVEDDNVEFIDIYDAATGIDKITDHNKKSTNNKIYNIAGQQVNDNHKGIIIKDGKKFVSNNK
ncbi:MAG: GDSL-type esterase/lipase family protein [Prevotella sp.]